MPYQTNPGSGGDTFASDLVGAEKHPLVKLAVGTAGDGALAPGDAANGIDVDVTRLPSIPAGANNIGDVDVLTVPAPLSTAGGGTEATALRVTIANDSTGVVSIDDNGGSITVDGTVAVSGTVTVGSHAVTNAGTFATQESGAALTALQLIDNLVLTEDDPHVSGDPGVLMFAVRKDASGTLASLDGDLTPLQCDANGHVRASVTNTLTSVIACNASSSAATPYKLISAASTNATSVKASGGNLFFASFGNTNAAARYIKFYNKASAPTVGTDTPIFTFMIPGNTAGAGSNPAIPPQGLRFNTGIAFAITTGAADTDTGAVALNEITVNLGYA